MMGVPFADSEGPCFKQRCISIRVAEVIVGAPPGE